MSPTRHAVVLLIAGVPVTIVAFREGVVVRCASCDSALIRLAGTPEGYWLDLRGVRYLNVRGQ